MQQNYEFTLDDHDLAITIGVEPLVQPVGQTSAADGDDYPVDPLAPPRKEIVGRVQWNLRLLPEHMEKVRGYQRKYGVTLQAIADQMVTEYLDRRGLI